MKRKRWLDTARAETAALAEVTKASLRGPWCTRQRDLAVACVQLARADAVTSNDNAAIKLYEESLDIFADLEARAPGFVAWQKVRERIEEELKVFRKGQAKLRPLLG
jgi:hypothetical protein